jgi:phosphoglycerate kinase
VNKKTVRDIDVRGKRVFLRADLNVPLDDGRITDDTRIRASLPTIRYLLDRGAAVILASHLCRPKGKVNDALRLKPVADRLGQLLGRNVPDDRRCAGPGVRWRSTSCVPVTCCCSRTFASMPRRRPTTRFAKALAIHGRHHVNDARLGASRPCLDGGITHFLPSVAGLCWRRRWSRFAAPRSPSRSHDHRRSQDQRQAGGARGAAGSLPGVAQAGRHGQHLPLAAKGYAMGRSRGEQLANAERIMAEARRKRVRLMLPTDLVIGWPRSTHARSARSCRSTRVPGLDRGRHQPADGGRLHEPLKARTIFWNGPMGIFEIAPFADGTNAIARFVASRTAEGVVTVVGGGFRSGRQAHRPMDEPRITGVARRWSSKARSCRVERCQTDEHGDLRGPRAQCLQQPPSRSVRLRRAGGASSPQAPRPAPTGSSRDGDRARYGGRRPRAVANVNGEIAEAVPRRDAPTRRPRPPPVVLDGTPTRGASA